METNLPLEYSELQIPGYSLESVINKNAAAVVFLAREMSSGKFFAIKLLHGVAAGDREAFLRLKREVATLVNINHPHIIRYYSVGEIAGWPYLVMDFVPGNLNVSKLLTQFGKISEAAALRLTIQVAIGLQHAWGSGAIHGNITAENLLIHCEKEPMIAGFGLATLDDSTPDFQAITDEKAKYISPEQAMGEAVDFRADIYALGTILYQMLTGRLPYRGKSAWEIVRKKVSTNLKDPRRYNGRISKHSAKIIHKMMAIKAEDRYENYEALIAALEYCENAIKDRPRIAQLLSAYRLKRLIFTAILPGLIVAMPLFIGWQFYRVADYNKGEILNDGEFKNWRGDNNFWFAAPIKVFDVEVNQYLSVPRSEWPRPARFVDGSIPKLLYAENLHTPVTVDFAMRVANRSGGGIVLEIGGQELFKFFLKRELDTLFFSYELSGKKFPWQTLTPANFPDYHNFRLKINKNSLSISRRIIYPPFEIIAQYFPTPFTFFPQVLNLEIEKELKEFQFGIAGNVHLLSVYINGESAAHTSDAGEYQSLQ